MKGTFYIIAVLSAAVLAGSCARETDESDESIQDRIVQAYVETHYPDARALSSGIYVVDSIPGSGTAPEDTSYVLVDYTVTDLSGNYISYTYDSIAKQLGTFTYSGYYYPIIWSLRDNDNGFIQMITGMKEGGMLKAVVPGHIIDEESSRIYEIYLHEVIGNAYLYQIAQMEEYADKYYKGLDSTDYGFYFRKISASTDSITGGHYVDVNYVGKFLDGTVFDTNIEDTARKYRIYNPENEYSPISYQFFANEDEAVETNDYVQGFSKAIWRMKYGEHAKTFFYSTLGYGDEGNESIPGFVPLFFEIWTLEDE